MVAKTEEKMDEDECLNTNPSTGTGMCQYGMSITGNGNLRILVPTYIQICT